jgi:hypothetical protein
MSFLANGPFDEHAWNGHQPAVAEQLGDALVQYLETQERGAMIAAYLHEAKAPAGAIRSTDNPIIAGSELQLELRRMLLNQPPPIVLRPPAALTKAATVSHVGTPAQASITTAALTRITAATKSWYEDSKEPFVVALSRNGVVFYHESFGPVTREIRFPIASIGIDGMPEKDPRAGTAGFAEDKLLLSPNTIGHGAGSSTVFGVDPDRQLVVAVARRQAGKDYDQHLIEFLQAVGNAVP